MTIASQSFAEICCCSTRILINALELWIHVHTLLSQHRKLSSTLLMRRVITGYFGDLSKLEKFIAPPYMYIKIYIYIYACTIRAG